MLAPPETGKWHSNARILCAREPQGFQSWHVQSYLDDIMWPARLRSRVGELGKLKKQLDRGEVVPMDVIELLEALAADNVVPHHWLHHGGHEYYYGGGRDDFF